MDVDVSCCILTYLPTYSVYNTAMSEVNEKKGKKRKKMHRSVATEINCMLYTIIFLIEGGIN